MDHFEFLEMLSRDLGDAEEALEICDPDEPVSLETCCAQMQYILAIASKRVKDFTREQGRGKACH